ncbi:hypothetical protein PRIPAC_84532 [Pristionchus pacificus]|uniref:Uncharacterized protein n=1 Tax=Pristionchus pacificus TaxID=54126 RepID=A0A454XP04_PRIPA|nr:hypothetical protein PRIPAC_84532 [Pristionchus pacificus]|eukprot:PDM69481.1 hypothetical protein PRIPAC_44577 [Pristionchus pacificus]
MTLYFDQPSYFYEHFEESSVDFYCDPDANCDNYEAPVASYVETRSGTLFVPSQQHQANSTSFESHYGMPIVVASEYLKN